MEFFKTLAELATENKIEFVIGIKIEKGISVVSVVPKTDEKLWTPFVMRGSPDELDKEFPQALETFKAALGMISNTATYVDTIKKEVEEEAADTKKSTLVKKPAAPAKVAAPAKKEEPKKEEKKAAPAKVAAPPPPETDEEDSLGLFDE